MKTPRVVGTAAPPNPKALRRQLSNLQARTMDGQQAEPEPRRQAAWQTALEGMRQAQVALQEL